MPAPSSYYTGSETPSDYSTDQAMYYPLTYYTTGYETPVIYSDQSNFFALDGQQNLHYSAEHGPYLYYVPGYGYMYSTPDQYSPYQYQSYQSQTSLSPTPSGYVQFFVQPGGQPLTPPEPSVINSSSLPGTSTNNTRLLSNTGTKNRSNSSTSATVSPVSLVTGASRSSHHNQIAIKPSEQTSRDHQGVNANYTTQNALTEQNRGPRTGKSNGTTSKSKSKSNPAENSNTSPKRTPGNTIRIFADLFKGADFSVDHPNAKFFVIKSYSEDDVHKSIKYNMWSSTPNGNRRLHAAYLAAQEMTTRNPNGCPVFLFFSVNASGQFCGVAEMVGPVDFSKHVDFWQQDKWQGSFPVKWHIIKDVLNASFRHITLENNENKPVTNSRDTQEVPYNAGINMLKIFKNTPLTSSVLEDFPFYEGRQLAMLQDKCRRLGRVYDSSLFTPAVVVKTGSLVDQPVESQSSNKDVEPETTGDQSEPEVESKERPELELKLEPELEERAESEVESKEKADLEAELKEKAELQVELNEKTELEAESKEKTDSEVEPKEKMKSEAKSKEKAELQLEDKTESQMEPNKKTVSKMESKEKAELELKD